MTSLSELLLEGSTKDVGVIRKLPITPKIKEFNRTMVGDLATIVPGFDIVEEAVGSLKKCRTESDIKLISNKKLKNSIYGVFLDDNLRDLDKDFIQSYVNVLVEKGKRIIFRALFHVYINSFDESTWKSQLLASALKKMKVLANERQSKIIDQYQLLEPGKIENALGSIVLFRDNPIAWLEEEIGLVDGASNSSLAFPAMKGAMRNLASSKQKINADVLSKIMNWVSEDDTYQFQFGSEFIIDGIMLNVQKNGIDEIDKKNIENFFLKVFSDPRFSENHSNWSKVNKGVKDEFIRWLTKSSLDIFLEIIGKTAYPVHWEKRREFWTRYMDANYVDAAYVVLGPNAKDKAVQLYNKTKNEAYKGCGEIINPDSKDQSTLLMKMGNVYISEGSHMKTLHIWKGKDDAPDFFNRSYKKLELESKSDFKTAHDQPGRWCNKAAKFIREASGNRIRELA